MTLALLNLCDISATHHQVRVAQALQIVADIVPDYVERAGIVIRGRIAADRIVESQHRVGVAADEEIAADFVAGADSASAEPIWTEAALL